MDLLTTAPRRAASPRAVWLLVALLLGGTALGVTVTRSRPGGGRTHPALRMSALFDARVQTSGLVRFSNPVQRLSASVSSATLELSGNHGLRVGLTSLALGRGATLKGVSLHTHASVRANRVSYSAPAFSEWIRNSPGGLEQGFTLSRRPSGTGALRISQAISGNAAGRVDASRQGMTFSSSHGALRYEDLLVTDAGGGRIPAWLGLENHRLTITINDRQAVYPLRIDPVTVTPVTQSPTSDADTGETPNSVAFSPNGQLLATSNVWPEGTGNSVSIFKVSEATGALTPVAQTPPSNAYSETPESIAFSPAGGLLVTSNYHADKVSVFKVDESTGALTPVAQTGSNAETGGAPDGVAFSPDGTLLAVGGGGKSGSISIFKVETDTGALTPEGRTSAPSPEQVTFSPDGNLLAATGEQGETNELGEGGTGLVSLFKVEKSTGALTPVTQTPASKAYTPEYAESIAFSPNGNLLVTADWLSDVVSVFTVEQSTGAVTPVTQSPASNAQTEGYPYDAVFSPLGDLLAVANQDSGTISLYEVNETTGALRPDPQSPASNTKTGESPVSLAFSPHGALIATANLDSSNVSIFSVNGIAVAPGSGTGTGTGTSSSSGTSTGTGNSATSGAAATPTASAAAGAGEEGEIAVSLACPAGGNSCGAVGLKATVTEHFKHRKLRALTASKKKKAKPKTKKVVVIAKAGTTLAAGKKTIVKLKLNKAGRALLKRFHKFRTIVTITNSAGVVVKRLTVTVKQPKKKHKKKKKQRKT